MVEKVLNQYFMKKLLLTLLLAFTTIYLTYANHVIGYDMALINIKNAAGQPTDMYKVRFKFFRDTDGPAMPLSYDFTVYKNSTNTAVAVATPTGTIVVDNKL